jgi:Skp family chaperone for outer membrane proteins
MEIGERRGIRWYEVGYVGVLLGLLGFSVFFMNTHRVAVVDMERVIKETGVLQRVQQERDTMPAYTKGTSLLNGYKLRMESLREKLQAAKTQAEKDKFHAQIKSSNELFQQQITPLQAEIQQHEAAVVGTFRRRLQPFIAQVAQKRGQDVVLFSGPHIAYIRARADLSEDVVRASKDYFAKEKSLVDPALAGAMAPRN